MAPRFMVSRVLFFADTSRHTSSFVERLRPLHLNFGVGMENLIVAWTAYRAACERRPKARITLRQGATIASWPDIARALCLIPAASRRAVYGWQAGGWRI